MATIQRQIRDAIVSRIEAEIPGLTVGRSVRLPIDDSTLPDVLIYSHGDRSISEDGDDLRSYTVRVEIRAAGRPEEDATDELAVAVRRAVLADTRLGGLTNNITWSLQQWDGSEDESPLAGTALDFECVYFWRIDESA